MVEGYRGLGGTAFFFHELYETCITEGYQHAEIVQIETSDKNALREILDLGGEFYKTHRFYERDI